MFTHRDHFSPVRQMLFVIWLIILFILCLPLAGALPRQAPEASEDKFDRWLAGVRHEARSRGVSSDVLDSALSDLKFLPEVIKLDRSQPESKLTFDEYLQLVAPRQRIREGSFLLRDNRGLLEEISSRFGVQPSVIVALWGIESDFGRNMGEFPIVGALATLAYEGRRAKYFRGELFNALMILNSGDITTERMTGSWAGAMGQCQFMPSSYLHYAVDFDGDGKRDIWSNRSDIFASIASYLPSNGWQAMAPWGQEVRLPRGFDMEFLKYRRNMPLEKWISLGVNPASGSWNAASSAHATLIHLGGKDGKVFAAYENWHVFMKWNRSSYFATTVGYLADQIAEN